MQNPPPEDLEVGIETYALQTPGCGGRIRAHPGDFVVEELLKPYSLETLQTPSKMKSPWSYFILEKENTTTLDAVEWASRELGSQIRYLGLKDKRARTRQHISVKVSDPPSELDSHDGRVRLKLIGVSPKPITRNQLLGNKFRVKISGIDPRVEDRIIPSFERNTKTNALANFYGHQRFGLPSYGTHRVGEAIVKKRFDIAVELLTEKARSPDQFEHTVAKYAKANPGHRVEALRRVPLNIRRLFVHSYQSFFFNKTLSRAIQSGEPYSQVRTGDVYAAFSTSEGVSKPLGRATEEMRGSKVPLVPLPGYALGSPKGRWEKLLLEVMREEGVRPSDFYIKELQEVSVDGGFRQAPLIVLSLQCHLQNESAHLEFSLHRGSYATILLRELMKPADYMEAGF